MKMKTIQQLSGCVGKAVKLSERYFHDLEPHPPNPYSYSCSLRCKHPIHTKDRISSSRGKSEDSIPEDIYKKYTETDSRPLSPDLTRRSVSVPRGASVSGDGRKCVTPEPETRQCQFHHRRILILDLRRVKSVDAMVHQDCRTPGTSMDSTYGDDDGDYRSSSANQDSSSILYQFSPRNVSISRSITPKTKQRKGLKKKSKERSTSPIIYERSTSPKILEGLTLPPLHSSVLTLLGQRSGVKPAPKNLISQVHEPSSSSGANKKLRRHGRTRNKGDNKRKADDESDQGEEHRAGSEEVRKPDEPHETQISAIGNLDEVESEQINDPENDMKIIDLNKSVNDVKESRRALHHVLDDYLTGNQWTPIELTHLEKQIDVLVKDFQKLQTKFKSGHIKLKEDTWLAFPRTWSRSSATFGAPYEIRRMKGMKPVDYLEQCVVISEPRQHLYSLVFQRHRMMENPTGKHLTLKTVKTALSEVLGRSFREEEMKELCEEFLGLNDGEFPVSEKTFHGISAFSERIYGNFSLESHDECHTCSQNSIKDKQSCHQNQKSHLESADLTYMFAKVQDGQVHPKLSNLIKALCIRN